MPDSTPSQPTTAAAAAGPPASATLAEQIGDAYATDMIREGAESLAEAFPGGIPSATTAEEVAAAVLLGAMAGVTRAEVEGVVEGAKVAVHAAELSTLTAALRAAWRAAKGTPDNPLQGLIDLADAAGVDLEDRTPEPVKPTVQPPDGEVEHLALVIAEARLAGIRAGGYTLARHLLQAGYSRAGTQDRRVYAHDAEGRTAYRFVAPGVLLTGDATVSLTGDRVDLEQTGGGQTFRAAGLDEVGAILALIARQQGLAAVFLPANTEEPQMSERKDPAYGLILAAVTQGAAGDDRVLSRVERTAAQVYRDLRDAGVIK